MRIAVSAQLKCALVHVPMGFCVVLKKQGMPAKMHQLKTKHLSAWALVIRMHLSAACAQYGSRMGC